MLNLYHTHLMDISEELPKFYCKDIEVILVDWWLQLHNCQVLIVEGVASNDANFMPQWWSERGILQGETEQKVGSWISREVCHGDRQRQRGWGFHCWCGGGEIIYARRVHRLGSDFQVYKRLSKRCFACF
jgi:hypothetical protein